MLCTFQVPRVQIPHSTPYKGDTTGYLLFYYTKSAFSEGFEGDRANKNLEQIFRTQKQFSKLFLGRAIFKRFY